MELRPGDIIFKQDQIGDQAYLIETGQVEIYHTHKSGLETSLAILAQGEIFGEMALIDSNVRSATTRALSDCTLMVITKDQLLDKLDSSDLTVQLIMKMLLNRLRQQNQNISGASLENINSLSYTSAEAVDKLKLESQINEAHHKNEFIMYHQPIVDLQTKRICGSEALIRWESPKKGLVSPGIFIDILENSSMIIPVGYWIIEECFRHSKLINEKVKDKNFCISINVSARQLINSTFYETLKSLVNKHNINPKNFKIEVTERVLIEGGSVVDVLNKCHELGFDISLDDFGTGFSSLQYLSLMPIDFLKIDRTFVVNASKNEKTRAVVSAIVFLAEKLNLKVIAEGIETSAESELMCELGCHYGQGFLFSRPVELSHLLEKL